MSNKGADTPIDNIEFVASDIGLPKASCGTAFGWRLTGYKPAYCDK